jgi:hypothetical protein
MGRLRTARDARQRKVVIPKITRFCGGFVLGLLGGHPSFAVSDTLPVSLAVDAAGKVPLPAA